MKCGEYFYGFAVLSSLISAAVTSSVLSYVSQNDNGASYPITSHFYNSSTNECKCDNSHKCIRKCCNVNYVLNWTETCVYNDSVELKVPIFKYRTVLNDKNPSDPTFISGWMPCALNDSDFLYVQVQPFYVQQSCRLWVPGLNKYFDYDHYCLEFDEDFELRAHICIPEHEFKSFFLSQDISLIGKIISLPFLLITFLIYAVLPLRNFHGKCLMCYVLALFGAYFCQIFYFYYGYQFTVPHCRIIAMVYLYLFVASFFWTNVMCIDIWLTFSGSRGWSRLKSRSQRTRFQWYSGYAWGVPSILMILILSVSAAAKPNTWYNPGVAGTQCWLNEGIPMLLYFYLPKALLVVANITLFASTASRIKQTQQVTAVLRQGDSRRSKRENDMQRFKVYLKLFLAMGVNWSVEIASWAINWQVEDVPPAIWYVSEFFNAAFGMFIFIVFVFKRSIWRLLKQRCCTRVRRKCPVRSLPSTPLSTTF